MTSSVTHLFAIFFFTSTIFPFLQCQSERKPDLDAFARHPTCKLQLSTDMIADTKFEDEITPTLSTEKPKGYLGTLGIVGGSVGQIQATYFAAMAAMRVGADVVHVFCHSNAHPVLQFLLPNAFIHPVIDINLNLMEKVLDLMDVIVVCQGLPLAPYSSDIIIPRVINISKKTNKPLVLDMDEYFLTPAFIERIKNYPPPGLILTLNNDEFEKFYSLVKISGSFGDSYISIDFNNKLGHNILIHRKGCTDTAMSSNPLSAWSLGEIGSPRRTTNQGDMISGATGVYFHWARNMASLNTSSENGPMFPAAVASYSAARLIRRAGTNAISRLDWSTLTSDILDSIQVTLMDSEDEE